MSNVTSGYASADGHGEDIFAKIERIGMGTGSLVTKCFSPCGPSTICPARRER